LHKKLRTPNIQPASQGTPAGNEVKIYSISPPFSIKAHFGTAPKEDQRDPQSAGRHGFINNNKPTHYFPF
jgi:hypothetical protein